MPVTSWRQCHTPQPNLVIWVTVWWRGWTASTAPGERGVGGSSTIVVVTIWVTPCSKVLSTVVHHCWSYRNMNHLYFQNLIYVKQLFCYNNTKLIAYWFDFHYIQVVYKQFFLQLCSQRYSHTLLSTCLSDRSAAYHPQWQCYHLGCRVGENYLNLKNSLCIYQYFYAKMPGLVIVHSL